MRLTTGRCSVPYGAHTTPGISASDHYHHRRGPKFAYYDELAHQLEVALSYGNKPMWDEVSEKCRRAGREDLPGLMRKRRPDWAERIDRA